MRTKERGMLMLSFDFLDKPVNGLLDVGQHWIIFKEGKKQCKISKMGNSLENLKTFFGLSEIINLKEELVKIEFECRLCSKIITVEVKCKDYNEWLFGKSKSIKKVFPYLSKEDQELFISRICKQCYQKLFDVWR